MAKLQFTPNQIENSYKVVDEGLYWITLTGFAPKMSKKKPDGSGGDSINFNPTMELTSLEDGSPAPVRDDGKPLPVFGNLNTKGAWVINDFCHGFGIPMETDSAGNLSIPGIWVPEAETDIEKCEYKGPLVGRKALVYLAKTTYNGKEQNKIKYYVCAVPNCAQKFPKIKHSTDLN